MRIELLDHGYVEEVEHWGSDEQVIEAARMSTGKGFQGWGDAEKLGDEKLLRYLWEKKHTTPFEMAGMVIEVSAPIMVFREWHRHRTQSYSEMSARYTPLPDVNYVPSEARCLLNSATNKQAGVVKGADQLTPAATALWLRQLSEVYQQAEKVYQSGLQVGIPKELARLCVPVGRYSRMRASALLLNWLRFLSLRLHPAAQWEIRQYAAVVGALIASLFPRTWSLFAESLGPNEIRAVEDILRQFPVASDAHKPLPDPSPRP